MSFVIDGLGTAHPPDAVTSAEGLALARVLAGPDVRTSAWLGPIYANSGVQQRFQVVGGAAKQDILAGTTFSGSPFLPTPANDGVGPTTAQRMRLYEQHAAPLAVQAVAAALREARVSPDALTHLVTVSCTGFAAPGMDYAIITQLGLKPTVARTHVGFMGCHGALNGLRVAHAFASANPQARVVVCAVELCSLHYYYGNAADKLIANALFADGAAAVVGQADPSPSPAATWRLRASGSCVIPDSHADMGWTIGDHGFEMTLSRRVPGLIAKHLRPWLDEWLRDFGFSLHDVKSWCLHPGGPKILAAVEETLGLSPDQVAPSREVFAAYGNMSSPTVLFILQRLRATQAPRPCVALGFGPGLVAEAALFV
ncbi:MAG: type III polyketide synthase [Gemmataceae bacterium]|nr:type III polyketide synthase [Gemmata sp.]MDW8197786.1 type III polyketide synthase [Gemmataceae bacterium]